MSENNEIRSSSKLGLIFVCLFALLWNAISFPAAYGVLSSSKSLVEEPELALVFLFPIIGLGAIVAAINAINNWRKFGPTPLRLDPFPGSISGHVGGVVATNIAFDQSHTFLVTLTCVHSYLSGTGKDRSRKERVVWQTEGVCFAEPSAHGTSVSFRFDVPEALPESDESKSGNYHLWRVSLSCELPGTDLRRRFEVPVKQGVRHSVAITRSTESYHLTVDQAHQGISEVAEIESIPGGLELFFPAFNRPSGGVFACLFGLIFAGVGVGLASVKDAPWIFPWVFTAIGLAVLGGGIWSLGKSLRVRVTQEGLKTRRYFFGYPLTSRSIPVSQLQGIKLKEGATVSSGNHTTIYYALAAQTHTGKDIIVAERLTSKPEVELLKESFEQYLGRG